MEEQQTRSREQPARGRAARNEVDAWLADRLKDGPAARERIFEAAEEAGILVHPTNNTRGASVMEARSRLEVLPLETRDGSKTPFWALPGTDYKEEAFTL